MTRITDDAITYINHNVYILGAGFSADAGLPLLNDFLYEMRASVDWLSEQRGREREFEAIRDVFKFRREASSAALRVNLNIENIEDLFSLAAASGQYPLAQSVSTAIAATLDYAKRHSSSKYVRATVQHTFDPPEHWTIDTPGPDAATRRIPLYELYAGLLGGSYCVPDRNMKNTVITFNYDTVLEDALNTIRVPFHYGFERDTADFDASSRCSPEVTDDLLPVLKLHGSINWAEPQDGSDRFVVYGSYDDIVATGRRVFLIPPTWRKVFTGSLSKVWDEAVRAISEATRIIIVGFSMPPTDIHVKFLLAAGLQNNISLRKLFFFNPSEEVERNLFTVLRGELKEQRIVEFQPRYTHQLVLGHDQSYRRLCEKFNRPLRDEIRRIDSEIPEG